MAKNWLLAYIAAVAVTSSAAAADHTTLTLVSGALDGTTLSVSDPQLTVLAGQSIGGSLLIRIHDTYPATARLCLAATPTWGDPQTSYWAIFEGMLSPGDWQGTVPVSLTAPTLPGTYYIAVAMAGDYNSAQLMSGTHPALPADWVHGNLVAHRPPSDFETAIQQGWIPYDLYYPTGMVPSEYAMTAVRVDVVANSTFPLDLFADFRKPDIITHGMPVEVGPNTSYNASAGALQNSWLMHWPGASYIKGTFYLDAVPPQVTLRVTHLSSHVAADSGIRGEGYSPVDIVINDHDSNPFNETDLLVHNYDVAENHGGSHGMQTDAWSIPTSMLHPGWNTVTFSFQSILPGQTNYWMEEFRICTQPHGQVQFHSAAYSVDKKAGTISTRVMRMLGSEGPISVSYATSDGSAAGGTHYVPVGGTLDFADGQTSATIDIPILASGAVGAGKTFQLTISSPTAGASLGGISTTVIRIVDVDLASPVLFVRSSAASGGDGQSWNTAYRDLQDALTRARIPANGIQEIWVAAGVYKPDRGTRDRTVSFAMIDGVRIYGGFAGTETHRDQKNPRAHLTILSGDLNGDDATGSGGNGENDYHVIANHGVGATALLDGFTITAGNANQGLLDDANSTAGGGMMNDSASPTIRSCVFRGNVATDGGGMFNIMCSNPSIVNCAFIGNEADGNGPTGYVSSGGGGMADYISSPSLTNCLFLGNRTKAYGGGVLDWDGSAVMTNCTFLANHADYGSAVYIRGGVWECQPLIRNSVFCRNTDLLRSQVCFAACRLVMDHSLVEGGQEAILVDPAYTGTFTWGNSGNIDADPVLTPDGHLTSGSSCIDAGDPANVPESGAGDIDGDPRIVGGRIDIGADQFVDADSDGLPDWWEVAYYGSQTGADPLGLLGNTGITNLQAYEEYSLTPFTSVHYVDDTTGDDSFNGLAPIPMGPGVGPKRTIRAGVSTSADGDTILVAPGTYSGPGNINIDFGGKAVVLRAAGGPSLTTIDCGQQGRALWFHSFETPAAAVVGFEISNGRADNGGGVSCEQSSPQIRDCILLSNTATSHGGGIYAEASYPVVANTVIGGNTPDGAWMDAGGAVVDGVVSLSAATWSGSNLMLSGSGIIALDAASVLHLNDSTVRCSLSGAGQVKVDLGTKLVIEGTSVIDLLAGTTKGTIQCDGLLRVRGQAQLRNANINVTRAQFEGGTIIANNVIKAAAGTPYGQFFVEDTVRIESNDIHADGDRYLDLDPSVFQGMIQDNRIYITITKGKNNTRGGLMELRGRDIYSSPSTWSPGVVSGVAIPDFNTDSWTVEELVIEEGAKVNLTNRFDFGNGNYSPNR